MKPLFFAGFLGLLALAGCQTEGADTNAAGTQQSLAKSPRAAGVAYRKTFSNVVHGSREESLPWECEPTLLYAAIYKITPREEEYVLDFCSVLSLIKKGQMRTNYIDVSNDVANELPQTKEKLQKYKNADQFYIGIENLKLTYAGTKQNYLLTWQLPALGTLHAADQALFSALTNDLSQHSRATQRYVLNNMDVTYRQYGMEFFDRKYGKKPINLDKPLPLPTNTSINLHAADGDTEYAMEWILDGTVHMDIDGTMFYLLSKTGRLYYAIESDGETAKVIPQFIEADFYKKAVKIPLIDSSYVITCKKAGLFGKTFKCE